MDRRNSEVACSTDRLTEKDLLADELQIVIPDLRHFEAGLFHGITSSPAVPVVTVRVGTAACFLGDAVDWK